MDVQLSVNTELFKLATANDETVGATIEDQSVSNTEANWTKLILLMYSLEEPLRYIPIRRYSISSLSLGIMHVYTPSSVAIMEGLVIGVSTVICPGLLLSPKITSKGSP